MDLLRLAHPWVVAVILPVWAILAWPALRSSPRRPGALGRAVLACLATGLLLAALAGPAFRVSAPGAAAVCILQDVSPSMALARGPTPPAEELARSVAAFPAVPVGLVRFDAAADLRIRPGSAPAEKLASPAGFPPDRPTATGADATDVAAGLEAASLALPDARGIVVLYTDARETRGDAVRAATRLAARGIQVHAVLPTLVAVSDVRLAALDAPPRAESGVPVAIRLRLVSTRPAPPGQSQASPWRRPADVTVRLERLPLGDAPAADWQRRVRVEPGVGAELLFEDTPPAEGDWTYTAQIADDSDAVPENNRASCVVRVGEPRTVLYVYSGPAPGPIFDLLRKHGLRATAARAEEGLALPGAGAATVILDNVSAWTLGRESARRLADLVGRGGLGLLVIGGDAAFAAGGYGDSPIEDVLPVSSRTGRRPPLEMVLVIDSSGSMNETVGEGPGAPRKITLAKQAVLALRAALAPADRVGIVAFAGQPRTVSPLVPASEWETLRGRLVSLEAGGGTRVTPALAGALDLLPPAGAGENQPVRHLLLLSDGRSRDFDLPLLIGRCRERSVSVSAVATGADADLESLGRLARETGGRLYRSTDLARLAEMFLKDLTWARGEGLTEGVFPAAWRDPQPVWRRPGPTLPAVTACNVTRPKEGASIPWETAGTEIGTVPLLAVWRRGLGKAAAMPWPAGLAGGAWTADDGLGRYLREILAWLEGPASPAGWSARVLDRDGRWWVRVEQRNVPNGAGPPAQHPAEGASSAVAATPLRFSAALFEAGAPGARQVALEAVEPGAAEADLGKRTARGATLIVHSGDEGGERMTLALPGLPPREYERFGVDRTLLERIVTAGGGKIHENPESLAEAVRQAETRHYMPVGIHLVWAAAAVVVGLVLGRLLGRL
ncbi:MAG: VWA domain-containing protein [Planctomycetota bacterium]|nr:VWA domain-containing protein [Planctomycetota bacterium]